MSHMCCVFGRLILLPLVTLMLEEKDLSITEALSFLGVLMILLVNNGTSKSNHVEHFFSVFVFSPWSDS